MIEQLRKMWSEAGVWVMLWGFMFCVGGLMGFLALVPYIEYLAWVVVMITALWYGVDRGKDSLARCYYSRKGYAEMIEPASFVAAAALGIAYHEPGLSLVGVMLWMLGVFHGFDRWMARRHSEGKTTRAG